MDTSEQRQVDWSRAVKGQRRYHLFTLLVASLLLLSACQAPNGASAASQSSAPPTATPPAK